ncbi:serine/threonine-protein kinase Smg1-like isoform X2 [Anopheles albimanus]|uniref:serine/threonine-protein kinase Smg1-like isoform X2 n=1 Tax=Anopheles albimanus TaxID=7167 RepID=UPI0016414C99|nr:serine/threonine-protein kinase Smg1-like isoform X2 [Anopheles albimanus]
MNSKPTGRSGTASGSNTNGKKPLRKKKDSDQQLLSKPTAILEYGSTSRKGDSGGGLDGHSQAAQTGGKSYQNARIRRQARRGSPGSETTLRTTGAHEQHLQQQHYSNSPEDMRISKLLPRLMNEETASGCDDLCSKLEVVLLDASNATYIRKSFEVLSHTICQALENVPDECHDRVAGLFGMILHVAVAFSPDGDSVLTGWIKRYLSASSKVALRTALIALLQAVRLDHKGPQQMGTSAEWLVGVLRQLLDQCDVEPEVFMLVIDSLVQLAASYPHQFVPHFSDVVDNVVGWMVTAHTEQPSMTTYCTRVLLSLQPFWNDKLSITASLIEQFVDDIAECCEGIDLKDSNQRRCADQHFGAMLMTLNCVLKCVGLNAASDEFFRAQLERQPAIILPVMEQLFSRAPPSTTFVLMAICDYAVLLLATPVNNAGNVEQMVNLVLQHFAGYSDEQKSGVVYLLARYLRADIDEDASRGLAERVFNPLGAFYQTRFVCNETLREGILLVYHLILSKQKQTVLLTAYRLLLHDIRDCMGRLRAKPSSVPSQARQAQSPSETMLEYRLSFNMLILLPLATARSSIFITWTLAQEPILTVLLELLLPPDRELWSRHGSVQHAIVSLAHRHALTNNHFISSSGLLQQAMPYKLMGVASESEASPTVNHFVQILRFLDEYLVHLQQWYDEELQLEQEQQQQQQQQHKHHQHCIIDDEWKHLLVVLLLDWCRAVLASTCRYHEVLQRCDDFNRLLVHLCNLSAGWGNASETVGLACGDCLDLACQYASLHPTAYQAIAEACCVQLCSVYDALRTRYAVVFSKLPLRYSLRQVNAFTGVNRQRRDDIQELKSEYQGADGERQQDMLRMADLRQLLDRIAFTRDDDTYAGSFLHELLSKSCSDSVSPYGAMALRDLRCLIPWAQWEAAKLCVSSRLRTPFGKPQATFLRIESIVKQFARILALSDRFPVKSVSTSMANQRHARILLGFLEALEKEIYNAAQGTAFALPTPSKPARTFFRTNQTTCAEWFTRIRTAVDLVALHSMEPEMVIRYSEAVLRELVAAGKTADRMFEHTLMSLVWALVRNWESDALYGVYVWSRQLTGKKYPWILMAAEEAAGHRETAAAGFRTILSDPASAGMDRHIRDFIVDQTVISLLFTGSYRELYEFLLAEEGSDTPRATIPLVTITSEQIFSILRYEETYDTSVFKLSQWETIETGCDVPNDFSSHKMICAVENSLSAIILQSQTEQREKLTETSTELIQCFLQECLLTKCREYLFQLTITNHILYKIARRFSRAGTSASSSSSSSGSANLADEASADGGTNEDGCSVDTGTEGCSDGDDLGTLNVDKSYGTFTLMRLLSWSEFLHAGQSGGGCGSTYGTEQQSIDLRLNMVSMGRKENNYGLCRRELEKYYGKANVGQYLPTLAAIQRPSLEQVAAALKGCIVTSDDGGTTAALRDENLARAVYEHCKWLYCQGANQRVEAIDLAACVTSALATLADTRLAEREARFLLTIAGWLTVSSSNGEPSVGDLRQESVGLRLLESEGRPPVSATTKYLPVDDHTSAQDGTSSMFGRYDGLVGLLLQKATYRAPTLAKAWYQLGSWLYRWGKRIVELGGEVGGSGLATTPISTEQIEAILSPAVLLDAAEYARIAAIVNEHGRLAAATAAAEKSEEEGEEDAEEGLDLDGFMGSVGLLERLQNELPTLRTVPPELLQGLADAWRRNHRTIYSYYAASADAYFHYLQLSAACPDQLEANVGGVAGGDDNVSQDSERAKTVTVTLRLLRLIVKHALGLKEVLEEGLATTPCEPWRVITPQLFSRLAHHEPYVRKRVSELLCRVAKDAPHLIIFPAVVGSVREDHQVVSLLLDDVGDPTTPFTDRSSAAKGGGGGASPQDRGGLASCFNALLDILSREVPHTVQQVQTLVHELRRISLLWEELWLVSLEQIYGEYTRRVGAFEAELQRLRDTGQLEARKALLTEKHRLLLRPLLFLLEQLFAITSRPAETNHERHFQNRYHRHISTMIAQLAEPLNFEQATIEGWARFRTIYNQLKARSQKRSSFFLNLYDVSPRLHQLTDTAIAMPGIGRGFGSRTSGTGTDGQPIRIRSVDASIQILPTKTRPKRMVFLGSNGRRFGYLSKGLEDLHLDERIMQFLSIANLMMTSSIDCNGNVTHYRAQHYSVIPLGPRSGLITWVDDTVPIYMLYKRWQQREALRKREARDGGRDSTVQRPSDLFYKKLEPLLQEHGLKLSDSRKQWPLPALKQVLRELQQETPRDLLAKELWCSSATASGWRQVVRSYSLSLAVMSVIGYIIGLGDRHLDNMLIKLATGEIVHIDYNVCFEKGHTLRVPEKVPFRMTQNLEEALGITGIEGTFRLACEHVLKSLKKGRETLLTLLEAFVYDPLFDWAVSEEAAGGPAPTATEITVSTMSVASTAAAAAAAAAAASASAASMVTKPTVGGTVGAGVIGRSKRQLEREVTRDALAVRCAECRAEWQHNRDELGQHLHTLERHVHELLTMRQERRQAEQQRDSYSQQLRLVEEAVCLGSAFRSHALGSLVDRLAKRSAITEERAMLTERLQDAVARHEQHCETYRELRDLCTTASGAEEPVKLLAHVSIADPELEWSLPMVKFLDDMLVEARTRKGEQAYMRLCETRLHINKLLAEPPCADLRRTTLYYGLVANELAQQLGPQAPDQYCRWYRMLLNAAQNQQPTAMGKALGDTGHGSDDSDSETLDPVMSTIKHLLLQHSAYMAALESGGDPGGHAVPQPVDRLESIERTALALVQSPLPAFSFASCVKMVYLRSRQVLELTKRFVTAERDFLAAHRVSSDEADDDDGRVMERPFALPLLASLAQTIQQRSEALLHIGGTLTDHHPMVEMAQACTLYQRLQFACQHIEQHVLPILPPSHCTSGDWSTDGLDERYEQLLERAFGILRSVAGAVGEQELYECLAGAQELHERWHGQLLELRQAAAAQAGTAGAELEALLQRLDDAFMPLLAVQEETLRGFNSPALHYSWLQLPLQPTDPSLSAAITESLWLSHAQAAHRTPALAAWVQAFCAKMCQVAQLQVTVQLLRDTPAGSRAALLHTISRRLVRLLLAGRLAVASFTVCLALVNQNGSAPAPVEEGSVTSPSCTLIDAVCRRNYVHMLGAVDSTGGVAAGNAQQQDSVPLVDQLNQLTQLAVEYGEVVVARLQRDSEFDEACRWLGTDVPPVPNQRNQPPIIISAAMVQQLEGYVAAVDKICDMLALQEGVYRLSIDSLEHHLEWAVLLAPNPEPLCEPDTVERFRRECEASLRTIEQHRLGLFRFVQYGKAIVHYERMRGPPNTGGSLVHTQANDFQALLKQYQKLQPRIISSTRLLSKTEEALVELLDPEGVIDHTWLSNVQVLLDDMQDQLLTRIAELEQEERVVLEGCRGAVRALRTTITKHDAVAKEIRELLAIQVRLAGSTVLRDYMHDYQHVHDLLNELARLELPGDELTLASEMLLRDTVAPRITETLKLLPDVFEQLFQLDQLDHPAPGVEGTTEPSLATADRIISGTSIAEATYTEPSGNRDAKKDQRPGREQKRNTFAVSVWRRIRMKLEGRDPDPNRRCGTSEQVNWMIQTAMDPNNLAVLYEGWTPWV